MSNRMDDFNEGTCKALARLDDLAKSGPQQIPEDVRQALSFATAQVACEVSDFATGQQVTTLLCCVMTQIYRAGYHAGRQDTKTLLNVGVG